MQLSPACNQVLLQSPVLSFEQAKHQLLRQGAHCYIVRSAFIHGKWQQRQALFIAYEPYQENRAAHLWLYDFMQKSLHTCEAHPQSWSGNAFGESVSQPAFSARIPLLARQMCA